MRGEVRGGCERRGRKESRTLGFTGDYDALLFLPARDACESEFLSDEMHNTTFRRRKVFGERQLVSHPVFFEHQYPRVNVKSHGVVHVESGREIVALRIGVG